MTLYVALQDIGVVQRFGNDRADPEHGIATPDQEALEDVAARVLFTRVRCRQLGSVPDGSA